MEHKKQKGFTIVELLLFLALSALFLMIALTGLRSRSSNVQFTDGMRSLASFMEEQRTSLYTGVNSGGSSEGTSGDSVILGKIFIFEEDSSEVKIYTVIGDRITANQYEGLSNSIKNDQKRFIYEADTLALSTTLETYEMEWGLEFKQGFNPAGGGVQGPTRAFAMVRDPYGQKLLPYAFKDVSSSVLLDNEEAFRYQLGNPYNYDRVSTHLCLALASDDGRIGEIAIAAGKQDVAFEVFFDDQLDPIRCGTL